MFGGGPVGLDAVGEGKDPLPHVEGLKRWTDGVWVRRGAKMGNLPASAEILDYCCTFYFS
jgi:hypothetical protein